MLVPVPVARVLSRVVVIGSMLALATAAIGLLLERSRFGADPDAARARIEVELRDRVATLVGAADQRLAEVATAVPADLGSAMLDVAQRERLFETVAAAVDGNPGDRLALAVYDLDGQALAWTGRPRASSPAQLAQAPSTRLESGPLGLQVVRVQPLAGADGRGRRGTLVAHTELVSRPSLTSPDARTLVATAVAPVGVEPLGSGEHASGDGIIRGPDGELLAAITVSDRVIADARRLWRTRVVALVLLLFCVLALVATGPLIDFRRLLHDPRSYFAATGAIAALLLGARALAWYAAQGAQVASPPLVAPSDLQDIRWLLFASPVDLLATALLLLGVVALLFSSLDASQHGRRFPRRVLAGPDDPARLQFIGTQAAAGVLAGLGLVAYDRLVLARLSESPIDILRFGLSPFDAERLALVSGLIVLHAAVLGAAVLCLHAAGAVWLIAAEHARLRAARVVLWIAGGALMVLVLQLAAAAPRLSPPLLALLVAVATAATLRRYRTALRHGSQAARLLWLFLLLAVPSAVFYPSLVDAAQSGRRQLFANRFAPEVVNQRRDLQLSLADALVQIEEMRGLDELVASMPTVTGPVPTEAAFSVWSRTTLAEERLTSSVELFNADGALVSRFALKLPEAASPRPQETSCDWELFEEVSPFFADERRLLHAARDLCRPTTTGGSVAVGTIVVHVVLDYANLSFISAQSPYSALLRSAVAPEHTPAASENVEFAVYGWSRRPLYVSGRDAWPLPEPVFARLAADRTPFWATAQRGSASFDVYYLNDRAGIYALGYPTTSALGHLVRLAELVTLAGSVFAMLLLGGFLFGRASERLPTSGRMLFREVRASFYRKLFLAFVLAAVLPVLLLAFLTRAYVANVMRADVETEAIRTATSASRVVADLGTVQARGELEVAAVDDSLAVWLSRVIAQDVNIFAEGLLLASSERNLFASGLLPPRTAGDVFQAIVLEARPSYVSEEAVGTYQYLVAAAPVSVEGRQGILTVPLTLRQQEIETQIDELDRLVTLAALTFILVGAAIGYSMAERIADPVGRLTRAAQRIARGELDARIVASSSDELQRLVEAFNSMAADLQRQRVELERTNRLSAWADMARQVAHDIKNPLTPIQLNAEHLRRVHSDRGRPLGAVLDDCVANILTQVRWLRQIAGEFSSFASSPQARPAVHDLRGILDEIAGSYRLGLAGHVSVHLSVEPGLPPIVVDRVLLGRALTNIVENALHAMPGGGELSMTAAAESLDWVRITVTDTGVGMTAEALARIFEPYFSTKASGTGLGLTIAKRNVELNGGTLSVESTPGVGTTVTVRVSAAPRE